MCKVFFENKVIDFIAGSDPVGACMSLWEPSEDELFDITKVMEKLGNIKYLCIKTPDPRQAFHRFSLQFKQVEAAGGIVRNECGQSLMIFRHGMWDLPKGHTEKGEPSELCALREIREECGTADLKLDRLITRTRHIYRLDEQWVMKRTTWYRLKSNDTAFFPQTEEGVTAVRWIPEDELGNILPNTYSTIAEVYAKERECSEGK